MQFAARHLIEHRVPAGLTVVVADGCLTAVGLPRSPFGDGLELSLESRFLRCDHLTDLSFGIRLEGLELHTVGHHLRSRPRLAALGLAAHPDADIRIALFRASEIGGHEVALCGFHDGGGMALGEVGLGVEPFIGEDFSSDGTASHLTGIHHGDAGRC